MNSSHIHARGNTAPLPQDQPTGQQYLSGLAPSLIAGVLAALCSVTGTGQWYHSLIKPVWAPVLPVFAPVQFFVFLMSGVALAHILAARSGAKSKRVVLAWFGIQLVLSVAWSYCFFVMHSPAWAYAVVMVLWCAVVALLWTGSRLSRKAFLFLAPLFLWVTFTSSLTFAILSFNILKQEVGAMDADPRNQKSPKDPPIIVRKK